MLKSPVEHAIFVLVDLAATAPNKEVALKLQEVVKTLTDIAIPL